MMQEEDEDQSSSNVEDEGMDIDTLGLTEHSDEESETGNSKLSYYISFYQIH
jgi:hypothetical protein